MVWPRKVVPVPADLRIGLLKNKIHRQQTNKSTRDPSTCQPINLATRQPGNPRFTDAELVVDEFALKAMVIIYRCLYRLLQAFYIKGLTEVPVC